MNHCIFNTNYNGIYCNFEWNYNIIWLQFAATCIVIAIRHIAICCNLQLSCNVVCLQSSETCNEFTIDLIAQWWNFKCIFNNKPFNLLQLVMNFQLKLFHTAALQCNCQRHRCLIHNCCNWHINSNLKSTHNATNN